MRSTGSAAHHAPETSASTAAPTRATTAERLTMPVGVNVKRAISTSSTKAGHQRRRSRNLLDSFGPADVKADVSKSASGATAVKFSTRC